MPSTRSYTIHYAPAWRESRSHWLWGGASSRVREVRECRFFRSRSRRCNLVRLGKQPNVRMNLYSLLKIHSNFIISLPVDINSDNLYLQLGLPRSEGWREHKTRPRTQICVKLIEPSCELVFFLAPDSRGPSRNVENTCSSILGEGDLRRCWSHWLKTSCYIHGQPSKSCLSGLDSLRSNIATTHLNRHSATA